MAANFLSPFSIVVLAVLLSQKLAYTPNIATGINGFGLNSVLASTEPFITGLEAFYSYDRFTKESSTSTSSRVFKRLLLSLLLLAGDIQLNPEPNWKFPCGSCNKPVKKNQKGFQCDHCNLWYHTKCCAVGDDSLLTHLVLGYVYLVDYLVLLIHYLKHLWICITHFHRWNNCNKSYQKHLPIYLKNAVNLVQTQQKQDRRIKSLV